MNRPDIKIFGARHHNLKNINVSIPANSITVITGRSGSGKSTLAVNVLFAEGNHRYIQSLGRQAGRFAKLWDRPDADAIFNIPPPLLLEQKKPHGRGYQSSTVATITGIKGLLKILFTTAGVPYCPRCDVPLHAYTIDQITGMLMQQSEGTKLILMAPATHLFKKLPLSQAMEMLRAQGFMRVKINGETYYTDQPPEIAEDIKKADIIIDRLVIKAGIGARLTDSATLALKAGKGVLKAEILPKGERQGTIKILTNQRICPHCQETFPEIEPRMLSLIDGVEGDHNLAQAVSEEQGSRLLEYLSALRAGELSWKEVMGLSITDTIVWLGRFGKEETNQLKTVSHVEATSALAAAIDSALIPASNMGLGYLKLDSPISYLSTGEIQRLRLGEQLGRSMSGILYIMDEPTTGLHPSEYEALWRHILRLKENGNTILIVEHDTWIMERADWLVELGPGAGENGGEVLYQGSPEEIGRIKDSVTAPWIGGDKQITREDAGRPCSHWLQLNGLAFKNLQDVSVRIPMGRLTCITGLSGSGKSALASEIARLCTESEAGQKSEKPGQIYAESGRPIPQAVIMDQSPVSGSAVSTPATYMGVFTHIRKLFSQTQEARKRGVTAGWFSLSKKGGRCERCKGRGTITTDLKILPPVESRCDVCQGRRFSMDAISILYKGKSISDVLEMSVTQAANLFSKFSVILSPLEWLERAGLGYLKLGQPTSTLSGGEAQRLKLARELSGKGNRETIYILDEPTMGLHPEDVSLIMTIFEDLLRQGHTVVVAEHDMALASAADHIIEIGPGSGPNGGRVVFQGTPEELAASRHTASAPFIKK